MNIEQLLKEGSAVIIDVRTPAEYSGGHVAGSINIPLDEITTRIDEIKQHGKPVVLCCASGMRSANATSILSRMGVADCYNGGSWLDVNYYCNN
jgi:rhodanese-related sulfurtransferase